MLKNNFLKLDLYLKEGMIVNMKKLKKSNAITLIALVITIIVLIILAGVALNLTLGENGLFKMANNAKEQQSYADAYEQLNLKIMEANVENIDKKGRACTLEELEQYLGDSEETQIVIKEYNKQASRDKDIEATPQNLENIIVQVTKYDKYSFLIGKTCKIEKVSIDGSNYILVEEFNPNLTQEKNENYTYLYFYGDECTRCRRRMDKK